MQPVPFIGLHFFRLLHEISCLLRVFLMNNFIPVFVILEVAEWYRRVFGIQHKPFALGFQRIVVE